MTVKATQSGSVDIDFTLGLNNKTGKYFFGRDMIEASRDLTDNIWYWRLPHAVPPEGLYRRILGRLARWDVNLRRKYDSSLMPLFRPKRPLVFTDPREVIYTDLKPWDVVLIHDVGPLSHPDLYDADTEATYRKAFLKMQAVKPFLLFVSESTRDAFADYFGRDYAAMRVTYINPRKELETDAALPVTGVPEKFLLTVGAIGRRKNQSEALKAYAQSGLYKRGIGYVICGGPEPGAEAVMDLARETPGVILTGYLPDVQLSWLYSHSMGFVLPSLLEGFGVPAMEAILYGTVPLVTRGGALNEVTGDAAILVDEDAVSISEGMLKLANLSETDRRQRIDVMRAHIRKFDWEGAVSIWRQTLQDAIALHMVSR